MRVLLCCGSRDWDDLKKIEKVLKREHNKTPITYLIEGGQESHRSDCGPDESWIFGADYQCRQVAQKLGIQVIECPANWDFHHRAAGPIRNQAQLQLGQWLCQHGYQGNFGLEVFAFHSDLKNSKGTKDMVNRAKKAGVKVKVIK